MQEYHNITCPFCSLHCTDLHLQLNGDRFVQVIPACKLAQVKYQQTLSNLQVSIDQILSSVIVSKTQGWLKSALQPVVVLCGDLHQEAVAGVIQFARKNHAILVCDEDFTGNWLCLAMKQAGYLSATLGEIRQNVDQLVICGQGVADSLPRLSDFIGDELLTHAVLLPSNNSLITIQSLRLKNSPESPELAGSIQKIQDATCGLVLFDEEWLEGDQQSVHELLSWLSDLNGEKIWYAAYVPPSPNSIGVVEKLLTMTGLPGSIKFSQSGVQYHPRITRLDWLVEHIQMDACLILGTPHKLPKEIYSYLEKINTILISPEPSDWKPKYWLNVAQAGIDCQGSYLRMDGIVQQVDPIVNSRRPTCADALLALSGEQRL